MGLQRETRFKIRVQERLKKLESKGLYHVKIQQVAVRGVPDILICAAGKFIAFELKVDSKLDELQRFTLEKIRKAGGYAVVVTPENWDEIFDDLEQTLNHAYMPPLTGGRK